MRRAHARRIAQAFAVVMGRPAAVERDREQVYRVRAELDGVALVFDDVDDACDFLVRRWWL